MSSVNVIQKILVIGSGPIQIGQGCEFDYSGTQACRALQDEGKVVVLVNSNPATIMTDPESADKVYIEPLTCDALINIIEKESPDAILPTMGGQVALNLFMELHAKGILEKHNVAMLGVKPRTVEVAEDRRLFKELVVGLGYQVVKGGMVTTLDEAKKLSQELRFPLIIRASFTLGGTGGGIAYSPAQLEETISVALQANNGGEIAVEESIVGWKEYELEVMRDRVGNFVVVCGIENINPMGVHTGDSITIAPCMTLTDREYQNLRNIAREVFEAIGMETGGANIQFAVHPSTGEIVVIEMNPRVSRSSALVSKATGYPIARISAKLALGYTLDQLKNEMTQCSPAAFEPAIDYVAVKIPRWNFDKFPTVDQTLGIQMKSVGEVLAFGRTFQDAFQKAWRSMELGFEGWPALNTNRLTREEIVTLVEKTLETPTPLLFAALKTALELGFSVAELHEKTKVGKWFLNELQDLVRVETVLKEGNFSKDLLKEAMEKGFSRTQISSFTGLPFRTIENALVKFGIRPTYKMVDTCAGEFEAQTPYYFKTWEHENDNRISNRKKVVILGSGPNRIGQGIEFDYACVHAVKAAQKMGFEAILINCNPETVSTDYLVSDKLYMEPLTIEDVLDILHEEKPTGVLIQFGGQTPLKLARSIEKAGYKILGSDFKTTELCENRESFGAIADKLGIIVPKYKMATTLNEAQAAATELGFPVLIRPSYVIGGQGMKIVNSLQNLEKYMQAATLISPDHPVLIDCYLENAQEFDVDVLCDGKEFYVPAILQHIEEAGIHSGDSVCVTPPFQVEIDLLEKMKSIAGNLALELGVVGIMNVQFAIAKVQGAQKIHVLEVNPRSSRTVPFVAKATGLPLACLTAELCLGRLLSDFSLPTQSFSEINESYSVKVPVFPYHKFPGCMPYPGPEMRSLGEVMGWAKTYPVALAKAYLAAGLHLDPFKPVLLLNGSEGHSIFEKAMGLLPKVVTFGEHACEQHRASLQKGNYCLVVNIDGGLNSGESEKETKDFLGLADLAIQKKIPVVTSNSALLSFAIAFEALRKAQHSDNSSAFYDVRPLPFQWKDLPVPSSKGNLT
jgi:carbamoyl-phosphate synthase large subunit